MKKSFKEYKENRELMEFGQKYDHLCHLIAESGVSFDEFWINHGMPYVLSGAASTEEELMEGWNPASWDWKGLANNPTVKAAGTLGRSALSGIGQGIGAMGRMAGGALAGAAQGFGQSQLGKNMGGFFNPQQPQDPNAPTQGPNQQNQNPWTTAAQAQPNQAQQPQPNQAQQPQPNQAQQPQPLNQNQQQAATTAMSSIKKEFNKAMQNLQNSGDPATQQLAKQFVYKINKYMDALKVNNGGATQPQIAPTVGTSMPQQAPTGTPVPQAVAP